MKLILALGNHPEKYHKSRHNLGFIAVDRWASSHSLSFKNSPVYDYLVRKDAVVIKPRTFMNLSADALRAALAKWTFEDILIVHDDIELPAASLRIRHGGGDGGHNGLKSLFEVLPKDELKRIRIGIGRHPFIPADKYVLQDFTDEELAGYDESLKLVSQFLDTFINRDFNSMLNQFSKWKKSYSDRDTAGIKSPQEDKNDKGL